MAKDIHQHDWTRVKSPVTGEPYEVCACGDINMDVVSDGTVHAIVEELTNILTQHLSGLSPEERQARIDAGRKTIDAFRRRKNGSGT